MLLLLLVTATQAYYGGNGQKVHCLDYSMQRKTPAILKAEAVECVGDKATFVGFFCNVEACAAAVQDLGGTLFKWGNDGSGKFTTTKNYRKSKAGWKTTSECWMEEEGITDCEARDAQYDIYQVKFGPQNKKATVVKKGAECRSGDRDLGKTGGVLECADKAKKAGGKYFIFGRPRTDKALNCYVEYTSSESCSQGFETDDYDFWKVGGTFTGAYTCRGRCGGGRSCHQESGQCRRNANVPETSCRGACSNSCCNMNTVRCEPCGSFVAEALTMKQTSPAPASTEPLTYGFAALGLTTLLYGSFKFYCSKNE